MKLNIPGLILKTGFPYNYLMKDTKKVAVALIQNEKGEYLLIRPTDYKNFSEYQDAWYPPTGHIKESETVGHALIRELKEELNLDIVPVELFSEWEQDVPGEWAYWWSCKIIRGEIKKSSEILDYKYFPADEIKDLKLWPAERKFFEKFIWK
jgi:ADP-ribose pyrophosphatase YjhB (NUDIX family)